MGLFNAKKSRDGGRGKYREKRADFSMTLKDFEEYALIEKIFVPACERGRGMGTELLREAIAEIRAEHGSVVIKLAALPLDRDTDLFQLVAWYEREGFSVDSTAGDAVVMTYEG